MPFTIQGEWVESAFRGESVSAGGETHAFSVHRIGEIELPSGRLAASDPFVSPDPSPFGFEVEPGRYGVTLAVSQVSTEDQRVAFARIAFRDGVVSKWSMVAAGGEDPSTLGDNEILGYGVDAGTGCFMSPEAGALLAKRMEREENYFERLIEQMEKTYRHTWSWAEIVPNQDQPLSIMAFSSGYGDGVYASYLGIDAAGHAVCVVTDFGVVSDEVIPAPSESLVPSQPPTRPWWKFWQ